MEIWKRVSYTESRKMDRTIGDLRERGLEAAMADVVRFGLCNGKAVPRIARRVGCARRTWYKEFGGIDQARIDAWGWAATKLLSQIAHAQDVGDLSPLVHWADENPTMVRFALCYGSIIDNEANDELLDEIARITGLPEAVIGGLYFTLRQRVGWKGGFVEQIAAGLHEFARAYV